MGLFTRTEKPMATLTFDERKEFDRLDQAVAMGTKAAEVVIVAGRALATIRDRQLFRDVATSWETYLERHGLTRRRADQMVAAATTWDAVSETVSRKTGTAVPTLSENAIRPLISMGTEAAAEQAEKLMISGERNLVAVHELSDNMDRLRQLFGLFEQKSGLVQLLDASSHADGVQIFIGGESQLVPMDELSVVVAPYGADGKIVGTLGVIGPTRMAYERVIPIVDITAKLVSSALSHG